VLSVPPVKSVSRGSKGGREVRQKFEPRRSMTRRPPLSGAAPP
jgi:hypothetical protein